MNKLDRYLIRETVLPFLLSLAVFTFILQINPLLDQARELLAKGVPLRTVGFLLLTLIPQALGLTIPIAFLTGLLIALGRLSADRESVALQACGVSPARLLRPLILMAVLAAAADFYVLSRLIANANQAFRDVTYSFLAQRSVDEIKPQLFFEGFPGKVLYIEDVRPDGSWRHVLLADTTDATRPPTVFFAKAGYLRLNREQRQVDLFLEEAYQYSAGREPGTYDTLRPEPGSLTRLSIPAASVFGTGESMTLTRGATEKPIDELRQAIVDRPLQGEPPHGEVLVLTQMFSFPVACLVFAPLALVLGLHTRAEGKLAGLTQGLFVVFVYYIVMIQAEAWTKGFYSNDQGVGVARWRAGETWPAYMARWWPNIALGLVGLVALWRRANPAADLFGPLARLARRGWVAATRPRTARSALGRIAVVVQVPAMGLPRPRLLDLYVAGKYLRIVALTFVALMGVVYLGTILDRIDDLFKGKATSGLIAEFLVYSTPQFVAFIMPMATLLGVLATIGALTRTGELTIMRACGISLYRAAMPLLLLGAVWSGMLFLLNDRVVARANQRAATLDNQIRNRPSHSQDVVANRHWLATPGGAFYHYQHYDRPTRTLSGLSVFQPAPGPEYRLGAHTHAARATFRDGVWQATSGWAQRFPRVDRTSREEFSERRLPLAQPEDFETAPVEADVMTFGQLRAYLRAREDSGFSLVMQKMHLQQKLAFPVVPVVMTLLAVPFAVTTGRRGALYGVGLAIALAFAYFLSTAVFAAAGQAAVLPPWLAAWATNILFCTAALYLTLRVRT